MLYVSPLKASRNDVQRTCGADRRQFVRRSKRCAFRTSSSARCPTGDTPAPERQGMVAPQQLLVTTARVAVPDPHIRARARHAAHGPHRDRGRDPRGARDKRGATSRFRWSASVLTAQPLQRIGLSATQRRSRRVGRFLVGSRSASPEIIVPPGTRRRDLAIEIRPQPLEAVWRRSVGRVVRALVGLICRVTPDHARLRETRALASV